MTTDKTCPRHASRARQHRALADAYEATARELALAADRARREAEAQRRLMAHQATLARRPALMAAIRAAVDAGGDADTASEKLAQAHGLPAATVALWWREHVRTAASARLWARDREIMRLAWTGRTNREIADALPRLGHRRIAPGSVSRIIRQRLKGAAP